MKITVLVDSNEFWDSLKPDILNSKDYVYIQTMSFEGDKVGKQLTNLLLSSSSKDRRLSVDDYSKYVISDKYLLFHRNFLNSELHYEASETVRLIEHLSKNGVQAKFTNHVRPFFTNFAKRNHKKLVVIDDQIVYLGGINFCEHNFHWHDMMLKIEDSDIAKFVKSDFLASWKNKSINISKSFGKIKIYILNGTSNEIIFTEIFKIFKHSKKRIIVESPYLTFPFLDELKKLQQKNIKVTIITPEINNRKPFDGYIRHESLKSNFDLRLYKGRMTHLKLMVIDEKFLIVGSSNFDYTSYRAQQEILAIITDREIIAKIKNKVIEKDLKNSIKFTNSKPRLTDYMLSLILKYVWRFSVNLTSIR
jgi:cardiolipin synthase